MGLTNTPMIREAIILAGGLGTRLQSVVSDVPKCMAPVNGVPFISYIIAYLQKQDVSRFIFALGYKNEVVIDYLEVHFSTIDKVYIIEKEQLGTGGAIKKACGAVTDENVIVVNGDTIFNISLSQLAAVHQLQQAHCTIALKKLQDFDRYGAVEKDGNGIITAFKEKQFCASGFINGGIYAIRVADLLARPLPEKFSFEKEYLEKYIPEKKFAGLPFNNYFIDIGVPEDYQQFQDDYARKSTAPANHSSDNSFEIIIDSICAFFDLID